MTDAARTSSHHELGRRFLAGRQDVDAVVREAAADAGPLAASVHPVVLERVLLQFVHQFHDVAVTQSERLRLARPRVICTRSQPAARFTKYLKTILRLSYDSAEVTINLRSTYDGRLIYKTSYNEREAFHRQDSRAKS